MRSGKLRDERKFRATQASITCSIHVTKFRVAKTNPAIDYPWKRLSFDNFKDIIHRFLGFVFICHLLRLRNVDSSISTYFRSRARHLSWKYFSLDAFHFFFEIHQPKYKIDDPIWCRAVRGTRNLLMNHYATALMFSHTIDAIRRPFFIRLAVFALCSGFFVNVFRALHNFQLKSFRHHLVLKLLASRCSRSQS